MLSVTVQPDPAYLVATPHAQYLHCDLLIANRSADTRHLASIELLVFDTAGQLASRAQLNENGLAPSIATLPSATVAAQSDLLVFNPFHTFTPDLPLAQLRYTLTLRADGGGEGEQLHATLQPVRYVPRTALRLPLRGRMMVEDGHDFYSHHRRIDITSPIARRLGLRSNANRFAVDLVVLDEHAARWSNVGAPREDWFGYGAAVYAPGDGVVVAVQTALPDNEFQGRVVTDAIGLSLDDPAPWAGNYVILDHENGEYSLLAHLRQYSVQVQPGEPVRQGTPLGQVGLSGSTGNVVHLHYELRTSGDPVLADGLPAYFSAYRRVLGSRTQAVECGHIDTGDLIESN